MLISTIKSRLEGNHQKEAIEWVMEVFRNFRKQDPASATTLFNNSDYEYKWINLY